MKKLRKVLPKSLRNALSFYFEFLVSPKQAFLDINKKTLEDVVHDYLFLLLCFGILAGVSSIVINLAKAIYVNFFLHATVQYFRMLNYTIGRGVTTTFFFIFAGTFLLFVATIIILFFIRGIKYTEICKIAMGSMAPAIFFGWLQISPIVFVVWSTVLIIIGINEQKKNRKIRRDSIENRD